MHAARYLDATLATPSTAGKRRVDDEHGGEREVRRIQWNGRGGEFCYGTSEESPTGWYGRVCPIETVDGAPTSDDSRRVTPRVAR